MTVRGEDTDAGIIGLNTNEGSADVSVDENQAVRHSKWKSDLCR